MKKNIKSILIWTLGLTVAIGLTAATQVANDVSRPVFTAHAANTAVAITPNDGADLAAPTVRGIWVGVAGDVKVDMAKSGAGLTFKAPVGLLPVMAKRVYATGTTATNLIAVY